MDKQTQKKLLDIVKRNYEEIADDFSETRKKYLWPELIKLTNSVKDGDSILDVGCGNGRLLNAFDGKKIEYIGVDNSLKLINIANSKFNPLRHPPVGGADGGQNLKFIVGDILELDKLSQNNFDYIFCIAVLHHIPGRDLQIAALRQLKSKLNPNRKIILTVWNLWSQPKYRKLIFKSSLLKLMGKNKSDFGDILFNWKNSKGKKISRRYYHAFSKRGLKKIIRQSGLRLEKVYKDRYNYYIVIRR